MRRAALLLTLGAASPAAAFDYRAMAGADFVLSTCVSGSACVSGVEDAELGLTVRAGVRDLGGRWDLKLSFDGREGIVGNSTFNHLYELSATAKRLARVIDVTFGRFRTPGGFWLMADGAMITIHYRDWLRQDVYGGLRSFTTGRRDTWMTSESPIALPLAGTSIAARHRLVEGSLSFTYAQDAIDQHFGYLPADNRNVIERHVEDEYFLDGQIAIYPHEKVFLSAGASVGSRYDIQFDAKNPYGATTLSVATLGAVDAYGIAEVRPWKRLRLSYTFSFERVRLFQSELLTLTAAGTPVQAVDGSFQDHTLRGVALLWRGLKGELSYRLRYRANTDIENHVIVRLRGDDLWRGLGGFGAIDIDFDTGIQNGTNSPALEKVHNRVLYSAGLSYVRHAPFELDLRAGVLFTDGVGSGLGFSQQLASNTSAHPTALFPYVLEANRIAFVRAFASFWKAYAGLDLEENLDSAQLRMLAQVGAVL